MEENHHEKINRVAKIIKVSELGKDNHENVENHESVKEHDPSTAVFITVILIIIAFFLFFIVYIYLPNKKQILPNDTTTKVNENRYYFNVIDIGQDEINSNFSYSLNRFKIDVLAGDKNKVFVNNIEIGECNSLFNKVSLIDNILFLYLKNNLPRQNRLIGIDESGNVIVNLTGVSSLSGMSLEDVSFNTDAINIVVSRIYDNKLILSSNFGDITGSDVCNSKDNGNLLVYGDYELSYKGNKEMNELVLISGLSINEYIKKNNLCN